MKIISSNFNLKPFLSLVFGFVLCTIVGTVSHEFGHCAAAKIYGRDYQLHYASMYPGEPIWLNQYELIYESYKDEISAKETSPEKEKFIRIHNSFKEQFQKERFYIKLGGPLQTMLTGMIGFSILWFRRKNIYTRQHLTILEWFAVLLAYFWSRQVFNFIFSMTDFLACQKHYRSDEPNISLYLNLPPWGFGIITCAIGGIILLWVTFKAVPINQRLTFLLAGLAGSIIGWFVWMDWLGPIILP